MFQQANHLEIMYMYINLSLMLHILLYVKCYVSIKKMLSFAIIVKACCKRNEGNQLRCKIV